MTTREIAEAAGVSSETVRAKGKELFPAKFSAGRKTEFNQKEAIAIMAELRKRGFIQPTENLEVPTNDRITRLETLVAAQIGLVDRLIMLSAQNNGVAQNAQKQIEAPPLATRDELRRIVNKAGQASGDFRGAWQMLYQEIYYRLHRNVRECAKNRNMDTLDYIDEEGILQDAVAIAREVFR